MTNVTWLEWARWFLLIVCTETTMRYGHWWWKLRGNGHDAPYEFRPLMFGVFLGQMGFAMFAVYALLYASQRPPDDATRVAILLFGDVVISASAVYHLIPCWRISCRMPRWRLPIEVAARGALAFLGAWLT